MLAVQFPVRNWPAGQAMLEHGLQEYPPIGLQSLARYSPDGHVWVEQVLQRYPFRVPLQVPTRYSDGSQFLLLHA